MINTVGALDGAVKGHLPRVWAFPKGLYPGATITSARLSPENLGVALFYIRSFDHGIDSAVIFLLFDLHFQPNTH